MPSTVTTVPTPEATRQLSDNTPTVTPLVVIAEKALRLREYPNGVELALMPKDTRVTVLSCIFVGRTQWAYVKYGQMTGWSAARYIQGACK